MKNKYALLVPCFNSSAYIEKFIEGIGNQLKPFDEILFYDDASTDGTAEIIEKLGFNVIRGHTNKGPSSSRNALIEATSCNWVHFHDPDDYLHESYLLKTSIICLHEDCDVVLCNVDWLSASDFSLGKSWRYSDQEIKKNPTKYTLTNPIGGINGLYNIKKIREIGGFNINLRMWEDADLHVRLAIAKTKFTVVEETLSYSLRHPKSLSSNQLFAWRYRYDALLSYKDMIESDRDILIQIGLQAETAASYLIMYKDYALAASALSFASKCDVSIPSSEKKIWQILKKILPNQLLISIRVLQLKYMFR